MARKCNLRRKIDRSIKRRKSMEERKAYRKKMEQSQALAKERMEQKKRKEMLWDSEIYTQFKKHQPVSRISAFSYN